MVSRRLGTAAVLVCALLAVGVAVLAAGRLHGEAIASRDAELQLTTLRLDLAHIRDVPWGASATEGDDPEQVRQELAAAERRVKAALERVDAGPVTAPLERGLGALWEIFDIVAAGGTGDDAVKPSSTAAHELAAADAALLRVAGRYHEESVRALSSSRLQVTVLILVLFTAFAWFYARVAKARRAAERFAEENQRLLAVTQREALTDALTGLGNRRALMDALERVDDEPRMLAIFDLNGFKQFNDQFGHPAGDALLARLGRRLATTVDPFGDAYRMGGDEFCVLAPVEPTAAPALATLAASALSDEGDGYRIACAHGLALIPVEAADPSRALALADERMYADKAQFDARL